MGIDSIESKCRYFDWVFKVVSCCPQPRHGRGPEEDGDPLHGAEPLQLLRRVVHVGEGLLGLGDSEELAQRPPALFLELQTKVSSDFTIMEKAPSAS